MLFPENDTLLLLPGPAGELEVAVAFPALLPVKAIAVICHPHPLFAGTMKSKIVTMLEKVFLACGVASVRFNFRGVGKSQGSYDQGVGEIEDALAVITWIAKTNPGVPVWLSGFSFGGVVALRAATRHPVSQLITVSPSVKNFIVPDFPEITCPWIMVQGGNDDIVPEKDVLEWTKRRRETPRVIFMPDAGHFFHGKLVEFRDLLIAALR